MMVSEHEMKRKFYVARAFIRDHASLADVKEMLTLIDDKISRLKNGRK